MGLLKKQKLLFFSNNAKNLDWGLAAMSETERKRHGKNVKFEANVHAVSAQPGKIHDDGILVQACYV